VRIDFVLLRIDSWQANEYAIVKVDSTLKNVVPNAATANICGLSNINDSQTSVSLNFTHTSTTSMTIVISTNLAKDNYVESFGIFNLMILVDYVTTKRNNICFYL